MENLRFSFFIIVEPNGRQSPVMRTGLGKFSALNGLGTNFHDSQQIQKSLSEIEKVISGEKEYYLLQNSDVSVVEVLREESIVRDDMSLALPVKCQTSEIYSLIREWLSFVKSYENGEIPGIIPDTKKDEWVIVKNSG